MGCRYKGGKRWGFEATVFGWSFAISWRGLYLHHDYFIDGSRPLIRF